MELTELSCKNCKAPILENNIKWDLGLARCEHCGSVFNLKNPAASAGTVGTPGAYAPSGGYVRERIPVAMPPGITMNDTGGAFEIDYRWFSLKTLALLFFAVIWNGFMLTWYGIAFSQRVWQMALFGLLHLAVGIYVGYTAIAGLINHTRIRVEMGQLQVRHGPLPWPGERELATGDIDQFYCKEHIHRSKNGVTVTYDAYVSLRSGGRHKLVNLQDAEQALYIEQVLEKRLGIQDRPMPGELR